MKKIVLILTACCAVIPCMAQPKRTTPKGNMPAAFKEFRDKMLGDYNNYRDRVLANYDRFLEGEWVEFATFQGEKSNPMPKPEEVPQLNPQKVPEPTVLPKPEPAVTAVPDAPSEVQPIPSTPSTPEPSVAPAKSSDFDFDFHGIPMKLPRVETRLMQSLSGKSDYAKQWRNLADDDFASSFGSAVQKLARECKFNDYLTFDLLMSYAGARFPDVDASSRASFVHFMLNNLGYDARLGTTDSGVTMLMLPLKQKIFARAFMEIDGQRYYVFTDDKHTPADVGGYINTCQLPKDAVGNQFDLLIPNGLNLPYKAHNFDINYGGMKLKGEVNANLMPILYKYPQMPMGDYAASSLMPELRADLVKQVKEQLAGMKQIDAVNSLLAFMQSGFAYATDEQQHGFEKPYFLEETLFYPQCDCEDRAVMYGYLLTKALGVENHLIFYPGHESVALTLSEPVKIDGDNYTYKNKTFYISDPTFIGAATGVCMPQYKTTTPKIDYVYTESR